MNKFKIPVICIFFLIILLLLHLKGMQAHLYMLYWYYDIIQHFLAGICIALSIYSIAKLLDQPRIANNFYLIIALTILGGLAWEYFEVYYDITGKILWSYEYKMDTIVDIIMDTLGGLTAYGIIRFIKNK